MPDFAPRSLSPLPPALYTRFLFISAILPWPSPSISLFALLYSILKSSFCTFSCTFHSSFLHYG
ncbi:hypothetical protein HOY82DRAFT_461492, partial [Tuber indicum]